MAESLYEDTKKDSFHLKDSDTDTDESIIILSSRYRWIINSSKKEKSMTFPLFRNRLITGSSRSDEEIDTCNELEWTEVSVEEAEPNSFRTYYTKTYSINC